MKKLTIIFRISFLLAVVVALVTYPVVGSYASKAQLVQLVKPSAGADLFGDIGELVGSPQILVNDIPKAAIIEGDGPNGSIFVDTTYLEANEIGALQLQTVTFIAESTRTGALIASGLFLAGLLILRWRMRALSPSESTGVS